MPPRMRAAVSAGKDGIRIQEVPRPDPGPGEVRVAVRACGICGSDLHFHRAGAMPPGLVPGHEITGVVEAMGPGVRRVREGDPVVVEPFRTCGNCPECRSGRDVLCRNARLLGVHEAGGLADAVVAPERRLFGVPGDLDPRIAALAEPAAVVIHGLRRAAGARSGGLADQRVLVLGAGSIGLLSVLAARFLGAGEVLVTARHPHQAELARAFGAGRVLGEAEATEEALDALGRSEPVDVVIETVGGHADTLRHAAAAVRPGGVVSVLGVFWSAIRLNPFPLLLKEVTLAWSYCYHHGEETADFADAVQLLDAERARAARLATHTVPLDEVERAFTLAADKKAGVVKVSVIP